MSRKNNLNFVVTKNEEYNLILLGESGVGKSTFINGLYNYFQHNSFDDAEKNPMKYLIPAQFTMTDENFNQVKIVMGNDSNESTEVGKACTQNAKSHYIKIASNKMLHIIDTPGIGDPEGFQKDKLNFSNTIKYISSFKNLNGICVLIKPNNARLDLHFRYCFKELLVHLHKNAAPNIVFCFTNSRSTFYRPGDTYASLEKLVQDLEKESGIKIPFGKENIFCFDNEAFRFLAALQQGVFFTDEEKENFKISWKQSYSSSINLFSYISGLNVHDIQQTVKLNEARAILIELAKPIAEISQNIQINIKLASDKKNELESGKFTMDDLENKLNITQITLDPRQLGHPRTVCTDPACTKVITVGGQSKVDYVTHCHPHCYLDGVKQEAINNTELQRCACMNHSGICKVCNHDWSLHMHISYENVQVSINVIDQNIKAMLDQKIDNQKCVEAAIDSATDLINQLQDEQQELIDVSAKFANFTRKNAIAIFNDDLDAYLDLMIREEEAKKQAGADNDQVLNGLRDVKQNYISQKKIFDDAIKNSSQSSAETIDVNDIDGMVNDLYNLPLSGPRLKSVIDNLKKISNVK